MRRDTLYISHLQTRGGAVWQLVGLITRRSQVQILSPQPVIKNKSLVLDMLRDLFFEMQYAETGLNIGFLFPV